MAESDQIEMHIQRTREALSEDINELQEKVKTAVDWRAQLNERPLLLMGLAFGGGVLLSALMQRSRGNGSVRRNLRNFAYSSDPGTVNDALRRALNGYGGTSSQTPETWNALKGAVAGLAANKIGEYLDEYVPGFQQEFLRRRGSAASTSTRQAWQETGSVRGNGEPRTP